MRDKSYEREPGTKQRNTENIHEKQQLKDSYPQKDLTLCCKEENDLIFLLMAQYEVSKSANFFLKCKTTKKKSCSSFKIV